MTTPDDIAPLEVWSRAATAAALLAIDPEGLKGLWLRARVGPARDRLVAALMPALGGRVTRIPLTISDEQLFGGVDLAATLSAGKVVRNAGLVAHGAVTMVVPMAERATPGLAARLAQVLDGDDGHRLIALDEGAEPDERLASALSDRLGLHLKLDGLALADCPELAINPDDIEAARARLPDVKLPAQAAQTVAIVATKLGISSLRASLLTLAAARASAALEGHSTVTEDDLITATELVLAPRATLVPQDPHDEQPQDTPPPPPPPDDASDETPQDSAEPEQTDQDALPDEVLLEAAKALLPADLLARLAAGKTPQASKSNAGSGAAKKGNRRGRPLPSRPGRLDSQSRIDLVATLRAAAPWQTIRRKLTPGAPQKVLIRAEDIRLRRFQEKSDRLLIFTVDASGSAAFTRLAEAKGAVEMLLAEAYSRRDHVALISFRGTGAEILLPPTRSLVQTKRRLAGLPGGGGTPLAAGLKSALELAAHSRGRGMTPSIALLTDGKANIALDGTANRPVAAEDARKMGAALRGTFTPALVIDMSPRPQKQLRELAGSMDAPYVPLPRADSGRLSAAVNAALTE